ncbi:MAG TPA: hypothetical protein VNA22_09630 [Pyrinomonadaceae bacterium]|nr:hypothetical protein [Pyrinomonadaceae bacterium]
MADTLEIAILGAQPKTTAVVFARFDTDMALEDLPADDELDSLLAFRDHVDQALHSLNSGPTKQSWRNSETGSSDT